MIFETEIYQGSFVKKIGFVSQIPPAAIGDLIHTLRTASDNISYSFTSSINGDLLFLLYRTAIYSNIYCAIFSDIRKIYEVYLRNGIILVKSQLVETKEA